MSAIRTPYNDIGAGTIGGTWTTSLTTGPAPLPPAAPGVYNGTLDFTGVAANTDLPYTYEVTTTVGAYTATSTKTITYNLSAHLPVVNDTCATATNMAFPYGGGCYTVVGATILEECPGVDQATFDGSIAAPSQWGTATFDADVWYKFSYNPANNPGGQAPVNMAITVDGTPYPPGEAIENPALAIYSSCSAVSLIDANISNTGVNTILISDVFGAPFTYYIRVSARDGEEGKFDLSITT